MDVRTFVSRLRADERVRVVDGTKHIRILKADSGEQLAVISRGAKSNKGRDVKNALANLRRNGIDLEERMARSYAGPRSAGKEKADALREDVKAAMTLLDWGVTQLGRRIYELQNQAVVGGNKFASEASARMTLGKLLNGDGVSPWVHELIETTIPLVLDAEAAKHVAVQEKETSVGQEQERFDGRYIYSRGSKAIEVLPSGTRVFYDGKLESARAQVLNLVEETRLKMGLEKFPSFPHGKGTFNGVVAWVKAASERDGYTLYEVKARGGAESYPDKALATRIAAFVDVKHPVYGPVATDMVWIGGLWAKLVREHGVDGALAWPYGGEPVTETNANVLDEEPDSLSPAMAAVTRTVAPVVRDVVRKPLHIRLMAAFYANKVDEVEDLIVEVMDLERQAGLL